MQIVDGESDSEIGAHNTTIVSQFTKQAIPFKEMSQHSNHYGMNLMLKLSEPKQHDTVLDVACGPGIVSCEFAKLVRYVKGIDLTPAMIEQAKQLQKEKNLDNIEWEIGDVSTLPFQDNEFSIVVTRYSLHHMINPNRVIKEMYRVCKPGGKILVVDVTPEKDKRELYNMVEKLRDPSHTEALTLDELRLLLESESIIDIKTEHHDLEMKLEDILNASFPNPEDKEKILTLFKNDVINNNLGMNSQNRDGKIYFYFPISMLIGFKPK